MTSNPFQDYINHEMDIELPDAPAPADPFPTLPDAARLGWLLDVLTGDGDMIADAPKRQPSERELLRQIEPLGRPLYLRRIGDMSERKVIVRYRDNPATVALALFVGFAAGGLATGLVTLLFGGF